MLCFRCAVRSGSNTGTWKKCGNPATIDLKSLAWIFFVLLFVKQLRRQNDVLSNWLGNFVSKSSRAIWTNEIVFKFSVIGFAMNSYLNTAVVDAAKYCDLCEGHIACKNKGVNVLLKWFIHTSIHMIDALKTVDANIIMKMRFLYLFILLPRTYGPIAASYISINDKSWCPDMICKWLAIVTIVS